MFHLFNIKVNNFKGNLFSVKPAKLVHGGELID